MLRNMRELLLGIISDNNLILSEKDKVHPNINDINCLFDYMEVLY